MSDSDNVVSISTFRSLASDLLSRAALAMRAGLRFDNKRDYYEVFGYKKVLTCDDYFAKYRRQDIAKAVIDRPADATWQEPPVLKINDSEDPEAWTELVEQLNLWNAFERLDKLTGLGRYATLMLGFSDGGQLSSQVSQGADLIYVHPYRETALQVKRLVSDPNDARFGLPEMYELRLEEKSLDGQPLETQLKKSANPIDIHWSRVIHSAENVLDDDVFGVPRLESCFNLLDDIFKVSGGSAENFWLSGRQGLHADIDKEMELNPEDTAALADEIEEYQHQLRRIIRTRGVKIKDLGGENPSPQQTFEMLVALLSASTGIPQRVLLGSEVGSLASTQDRANWAERIEERRNSFAEPTIIKPFVSRMQSIQVLPEGKIEVEWPPAFRQNPLEDAQTMAQKARAVTNFARQAKDGFPIVTREEARVFVGLPKEIPAGETLPGQPQPRPTRGRQPSDVQPEDRPTESPADQEVST